VNRVEATLRGIASDLDALHIRWALVGGFAVSVRTEPRFTRDVDVAVLTDGDPAADGWSDRSSRRVIVSTLSSSRTPLVGWPPHG
jgi:Nucleotidyl transferase AbiEii toxin, Type IV TA system